MMTTQPVPVTYRQLTEPARAAVDAYWRYLPGRGDGLAATRVFLEFTVTVEEFQSMWQDREPAVAAEYDGELMRWHRWWVANNQLHDASRDHATLTNGPVDGPWPAILAGDPARLLAAGWSRIHLLLAAGEPDLPLVAIIPPGP